MLPAYEAAGVAFTLVPSGVKAFPAGAAVPVYHGSVTDIWKLSDPAPYWSAEGCVLTGASRLSVTADCVSPTALRRLELAWLGWRAWVDGLEVPVAARSGVFQAVALPAGNSHVVFSFEPPGARFAWAAFAAGILMIGFFVKKRGADKHRVVRAGTPTPSVLNNGFATSLAYE